MADTNKRQGNEWNAFRFAYEMMMLHFQASEANAAALRDKDKLLNLMEEFLKKSFESERAYSKK